VLLEQDQSSRSIKLPLEMYSTDPDATLGSWGLLEEDTAEEQDAN